MLNSKITLRNFTFYAILFNALFWAIYGVGRGGMEIVECFVASGWPTVEGKITASGIDTPENTRRGERSSETCVVRIGYAYEVDGYRFTGDRVTFGSVDRSSSAYALDTRLRYLMGATVEVHYNPDSPSDSVLDTSTTLWSWLMLFIGVGMVFVLVLMVQHVIWKAKCRQLGSVPNTVRLTERGDGEG